MTPANWIALASVGAVVIVGLGGMVANARTQKREREHREREADADRAYRERDADADRGHREREADAQREHALAMARAARFFEARLHAYGEAGRMLERIRLNVQRIEPAIVEGERTLPPGGFDDAEWEAMVATVSIASSPQVLAAIEVAHTKFMWFRTSAGAYVALREGKALKEMGDAGRQMEMSRAAASDAIDAAEQMMRDELHAL